MYHFSTGLPDDRACGSACTVLLCRQRLRPIETPYVVLIPIAHNLSTTHPQLTLHPVSTQQSTLFYTHIFLIQSFSNHKHSYKNPCCHNPFFPSYSHPNDTNCDVLTVRFQIRCVYIFILVFNQIMAIQDETCSSK